VTPATFGTHKLRIGAALLAAALLGGCGGQCRGEAPPDTVTIDAAALETPDRHIEVCIIPDEDDSFRELCSERGSPHVSWSAAEGLPDSVGYVVRETGAGSAAEVLTSGTYVLECRAGTVRLELPEQP
jgi:hypothetical protein